MVYIGPDRQGWARIGTDWQSLAYNVLNTRLEFVSLFFLSFRLCDSLASFSACVSLASFSACVSLASFSACVIRSPLFRECVSLAALASFSARVIRTLRSLFARSKLGCFCLLSALEPPRPSRFVLPSPLATLEPPDLLASRRRLFSGHSSLLASLASLASCLFSAYVLRSVCESQRAWLLRVRVSPQRV